MNARPSIRTARSGRAALGAGRWALGTLGDRVPTRTARSGRAALGAGHWALGRAPGLLALLALLLWPAAALAQTPPPPAPGAGGEIVEYYATDALGSIRVVFTAAGAEVARADYLPFGERFHTTGPLPPQQFTGQQRDPEAQLDHFNARSYQTTTGRFTGMDPVYAGLFDPQQWNRYEYARANPLIYVDPQGLETFRISVNCSETFNVGCTQDPKAGTGPVGPSAWFLFGGMNPFGVSYPERTLPLSFFTKGNHRPSRDYQAIGETSTNVGNPERPDDDPVPTNEGKLEESTNACTRTGSSTCVAQCIDRRRFNLAATAGTLAAYGASMPIDKDRVIYKNQPYTNRISKLAGRFGGRTTAAGSAIRTTGRFLSKFSWAAVVGEGFYDWYVIGDCTIECRRNPCAH